MNFNKSLRWSAVCLGASLILWMALAVTARLITWRRAGADQLSSEAKTAVLKARNSSLRKKLDALAPKGHYLVIDTGRNILTLRRGKEDLRQAVISTGSGTVLKDPSGKHTWVFDTPRGEYSVRSKATDPTWIKPDWAFIEEGEPPPSNYNDRMEEGVLGDYALGFGNGYFIHGTLYTRLLGRNVTHGCVRVGDDDLEYLYKTVPLGTKIYIY